MLVNGKWVANWQPVQASDDQGRFVRQVSSFRNWITADGTAGPTGSAGFKAEAGRYRLYVALICPWASRTLIARKLKGLEGLIAVTVVNPVLTDQGWVFGGYPGAGEDPLHGAQHMHQLYTHADDSFSGRATVPVLWDEKTDTMVSNESADIVRMLNTAFAELVPGKPDLYPANLRDAIDVLNADIYDSLNNGVYKAGFASTQAAYDEAVAGVFAMLDRLEDQLTGDFLFGNRFTEADIRLFVTLIRFDAAYHGLFKTNIKRIADYPRLSAYLERVLRIPGVRGTVNIDHIKAGYYSIKALNPGEIVPVGPGHVTALLEEMK
ncbi:glutathione S-transferase family protein [Sulfitobacter sp. M57]|jgi:putative glutathione S-transferase|uniref:glutathione S-transferase family protein n=1 Tax=unclassified Sulfitobacter TaxID=196795 RepID=UPI0023E1E58D|nr:MULTISPECIES: glutathione S-transferase family protein [unclassified Sulfitobacter]MDF3416340.1 glutathione S-transferase family protein [Sulfitobacter sp. KE5]MDF3423819.1 glutathione S-transferase family protein [Sulfitobacter sp. KE43]MDF3434886.1 glutathione S-transferase family protein [Sulfitobacter sp. KE42]MDF3460525.1 glutathione S-transferase family protein [Sulfitobacter sp. S74]MDF3464423.1 glutathione S-transferase family protein [Sulfitobacter sp. Ks18]